MVNKFGKKTLLLLVLILAIVVTTLGVATAETTVEEVKLVSDSEVVICTKTTLSGAPNTYMTVGPAPKIEAKIGGEWKPIDATKFTWTGMWPCGNVRSDGVVTFISDDYYKVGGRVITGKLKENEAITVSYTIYPSAPIATKEDLEILTSKSKDAYAWGSASEDRSYALVADIDYMSDNWHERYLKPIALSKYHATATTFAGIFGDVPSYNGQQVFYGRIDGQGFAIKNAVLALGSAFKTDANFGMSGYGQNWIQNLSGAVANIKFENLTFESAAQALANPYMYTVATNPILAGRYTDASPVDGKDDATGIPVVTDEGGAVVAIDIDKFQKDRTWSTETVKSTLAQDAGLFGVLGTAKVDNVYVEANIHSGAAYYSSAQIYSGVLAGEINANAGGEVTKITNCVIVPTLTEGIFTPSASVGGSTVAARDNYYKYIGGIVGLNKETTATDTIENCALILKSDSGLKSSNTFNAYVGMQVYGGRSYNSPDGIGGPYNVNTINTTGLKNVKIYEGGSAMNNYLADADMEGARAEQEFNGYWRASKISASIYQGEYEGVKSTVLFGSVDTDMFKEADIEIGVRLVRDGIKYEFKFNDEGDKALREDGMFGMALKELAVGDWTATVYVKTAAGKEVLSESIKFTVEKEVA